MRNKFRLLLIFTILTILLSSCSYNRFREDSRDRLKKNLALWNEFKFEGLASIRLGGFNFFKNIVLTNNPDSLKIILYEGGIFGSSPQPFAEFTLSDSISLELPFPVDTTSWKELNHDLLSAAKFNREDYENIINDLHLSKGNLNYIFNDRYQLSEIELTEEEFKIIVEYDLEELPCRIEGIKEEKLLFEIEIDKFYIKESNT